MLELQVIDGLGALGAKLVSAPWPDAGKELGYWAQEDTPTMVWGDKST